MTFTSSTTPATEPAPASNGLIHRLLLGVPAGLGALLALLVLALGSIPLASQVQLQAALVDEKRLQEQQLPLLRSQLRQLRQRQRQAELQQQRLIGLIAGSGELVTFMAQADREARRHGVQLELYEPKPALVLAEGDEADALKGQAKGTRSKRNKQAAAAKEAETAAQRDPLQQAGLSTTTLLLSAKGRYPNLLAFLRALEALSLLVVQSNLQLNQELPDAAQKAAKPATAVPPNAPITLKLAVTLYSAKPQS